MSDIRTAIAAADEEYLVTLANKGLYNRALRELPDAGIVVAAEGENIRAQFADGSAVTMDGSILRYTCTCPSRSVCKHLLMAVLAAQELFAGAGAQGQLPEDGAATDAGALDDAATDAGASDAGDAGTATGAGTTDAGTADAAAANAEHAFAFIAETSAASLEKIAGKRRFRAAVTESRFLEKPDIREASTLTLKLPESGATVRFLPGAPLETAGCTCKSPDFCSHRIQAVLQYIIEKKGSLPQEFLPEEKPDETPEIDVALLDFLRHSISEVFSSGLARLPENSGHRFLQLATLCHSRRLADPERLCNRVAGQLEHFAGKSAVFQKEYLIGDLCRLLKLCDLLEKEGANPKIAGVFRDEYHPVAVTDILGLGAYGWHSTGGYTGVTTLFYAPELRRVLRYTAALPDNVSSGAVKMYNAGAPWGLNARLSALSHSALRIRGGKLSANGQLSATESCHAEPLGPADVADPALSPLRYADFDALLEALWEWTEKEKNGESAMTALLVPDRMGPGSYDRIQQRFSLPLYDAAGRALMLRVRYEAATELLLDNLAMLEKEQEKEAKSGGLLGRWFGQKYNCGVFLANVRMEEGALAAFPVTHYGQNTRNLSLDEEKNEINAFHFDWGN
ncbi:MAG: SWIM zinc finger family protein [Clostridiales Family XIII bacterium]|jgi:hypothetical protein|nr:SWIM zinc finger family protein [Clostridiales Family XIII bacterium]